jgi:methylmalonyl-CoA mutase cobalamin-binding subunit
LREVAGRFCLTAEELAAQALAQGFHVVAICGIAGQGVVTGPPAAALFAQSLLAPDSVRPISSS